MNAGDVVPPMMPCGFGRRCRNAKRAADWRAMRQTLDAYAGEARAVLPLHVSNERTELIATMTAMEARIVAHIHALETHFGEKMAELAITVEQQKPAAHCESATPLFAMASPHSPKSRRVRLSEASTEAPSPDEAACTSPIAPRSIALEAATSPNACSAPPYVARDDPTLRLGAVDFVPGAQEHRIVEALATSLLGAAPWRAGRLLAAGFSTRTATEGREALSEPAAMMNQDKGGPNCEADRPCGFRDEGDTSGQVEFEKRADEEVKAAREAMAAEEAKAAEGVKANEEAKAAEEADGGENLDFDDDDDANCACLVHSARREICETAVHAYSSIKTGADLRQLETSVPFHFERAVDIGKSEIGCNVCDDHCEEFMWWCCLCDRAICDNEGCLSYHMYEDHVCLPSDASSDFEDAWDDLDMVFDQWRSMAASEQATWSDDTRRSCECLDCRAYLRTTMRTTAAHPTRSDSSDDSQGCETSRCARCGAEVETIGEAGGIVLCRRC